MATSLSYNLTTLVHNNPTYHHHTISISITNTNSLSLSTSSSSSQLPPFSADGTRKLRSLSTVTRAGPTASQFAFALVFPLSLLGITAFSAYRIGERLDQKFLEELAMNEAVREAEEEDAELSGVATPAMKEEPAFPASRNRPKREV